MSTRPGPVEHEPGTRQPHGRIIGLAAGLALFALALSLPPPEGMLPAAWRVAAVAVLMAIWWVTEALPVPVTALARH